MAGEFLQAMAGEFSFVQIVEFSGDSEWRVVVADELLFIFGFIRASILCDDGLD